MIYFFVACHLLSVDCRFRPLGIIVKIVDWKNVDFSANDVSGIIVQYPNTEGTVEDYSQLVSNAHKHGVSRKFVSLQNMKNAFWHGF